MKITNQNSCLTSPKSEQDEYYLGLDIGTDSVGFAVTDSAYNVLRKKGKDIIGFRLFDSGETAEDRRTFRAARRRIQRRKQRIKLLQELFSTEVCKIDQGFYHRLEQSFYRQEHKSEQQYNTLFNDKSYTDRDYHTDFPTIYHLRHELCKDDSKKFDIRLLYLAIAHILKKRGHFLYEGRDINIDAELSHPTEQNNLLLAELFSNFAESVYNLVDRLNEDANSNIDLTPIDFSDMLNKSTQDLTRLQDILAARTSLKTKKINIYSFFNTNDKQTKKFLDLLCGAKVTLYDLFLIDEIKEQKESICFADSNYDDNRTKYNELLGDKMSCIDYAKQIYDWALLVNILGENKTLSEAKVASYVKHKNDLRILKNIIKENCSKEIYFQMFNDDGAKSKNATNYIAYIGKSKAKNNASFCTREVFYKEIKKIIETIPQSVQERQMILDEIENETFMPLQSTGANSTIPYQLHENELKMILQNAAKHYAFLNEKCPESNLTISEKIHAIFTFRIPYYIGTLNTEHKKQNSNLNCWAVRKDAGKIQPWNLKDKIDVHATAEQFIKRMTNKCTYLVGDDVLPKNSLLYSRFMVLNEINNLKISIHPISINLKQDILNDLFYVYPKVTRKRVKDYLIAKGEMQKNDDIAGIDDDFKCSMKPYFDLKNILGSKVEDEILCEEIILILTLFGGEKQLIVERLKNNYASRLSKEEIQKISNLQFKGWGSLSREFLEDISGMDTETGEVRSIIDSLYETNDNLMQLLSYRYTYADEIKKHNEALQKIAINEDNYKEFIQELYCSPAVKRSINQALRITMEIIQVMGHAPNKIFIEVAREEGKKQKTKSRRQHLLELYKKCKNESVEFKDLLKSIEAKSDADLRSKHLYLYYTQMGRCMYSDEPIELSNLFAKNIYDIDHIYPRAKTKDDSMNNLVLVKRSAHDKKKDFYPIPDELRNGKTMALWGRLQKMNLISKEKYARLTRCTGFNDNELAGFINRQLVETRQSTKAVAQMLNKLFPKSKLVYSKAGNVTAFRQDFDLIKVREINDYHHAEDAYLNIVVGNVYYTKFTSTPLKYIKSPKVKYHLGKMYNYDIVRGHTVAWLTKPMENGVEQARGDDNPPTIDTVRLMLQKKRFLFTRHCLEVTGEFFKQKPLKKGHGQVQLKNADTLLTTELYGGYDKAASAYFFLVKHFVKNKEVRSIEFVPVYLAKSIAENKLSLINYCVNNLKLIAPSILLPKIHIYTLFNINAFPMHITGRSDSRLLFAPAVQFHVDNESKKYFKKIVNFWNRLQKDNKKELKVSSFEDITQEKNIALYRLLIKKHQENIYLKRPGTQSQTIEDGQVIFENLTIEDQCIALYKIMQYFQCRAGDYDLKLIGGSTNTGKCRKQKVLNVSEKPRIIAQSVTGLYTREIDLFSL